MEIHGLIEQYAHNPEALFFVAAALGGQEMILPLAFLVGTGMWSLPKLFIVCFIATIGVDLFWFGLARFGKNWNWFKRLTHEENKVKKFIQKLSKHDGTLLLITKFLYGTRVISVLYLSLGGLKVLRFLVLNMLVTLPWLISIIAVGWLAGQGSHFFGNILKHPVWLTLGVVALVLIYQQLMRKLEKRCLKEDS